MYVKNGISVLKPNEFDQLRQIAKKPKFKVWMDLLLYTGMRYVECERFVKEADKLYKKEQRAIYLPKSIDRKKKRTSLDRYVYLSNRGVAVIENFLDDMDRFKKKGKYVFSSISAMQQNLKRWSLELNIDGNLSPKSFRKTWECWLAAIYPDRLMHIAQSQGHTQQVSTEHYIGIPFTRFELEEIRPRVEGWFGYQ